jgi:hypothetical protein
MPRKLPRAVLVFRVSALFVTLLTAFVALAVLAQVTSAGHASGKSGVVSAMARAGTPAQEPQHTLPPLFGSAAPAAAASSHAKNSGVVATGLGNFLFRPAVTYGTGGGYAYSVTAADVNGDGKADLIVTGFYSQTLGVLLGNGDGTFHEALVTNLGWDPLSVAAADVNGDGKPDLIIALCCESNGDGEAAVLLGNGDGTFHTPVFYDSGGRGGGPLGVADVNGDGRTDILFVNWTDSNGNMPSLVAVLLGNGDGTFQSAKTYQAGYDASCLAIADVNKDGKPDVFVCTENKVAVLLGNGDGSFQPYSSYLAGYCENTIAVADVNGDGAPDLLVGNEGPNSCAGVGFVGVLLGNGNGTFQPEINFDTGNQAVGGIAVADVNSDGKLDAVATSGDYRDGLVGVVLGNGDGTFQPAISYSSRGSHPDAIVVANLNGDNQPDIVVANFYDGNVGVLMNKGRFLTTTMLASSLNPSYFGQPVTFTATVESKHGTIPDGGLVTFYDGTTALGSGALVSGTAAFTTSSLSAKTHTIKATYAGNAIFKPSTGTVRQIVNKYATTTALSSSLNPSAYGQAVTFTATVTGAGPSPTGKVRFMDGTTGMGTGTLSGGVAKLTNSTLTVGTHPITAQYLGDVNSARSTSSALDQVVQ